MDVADELERALRGVVAQRVAAFAELGTEPAAGAAGTNVAGAAGIGFAQVAAEFALQGGKRIRPQFAYWGWRAARAADRDGSGGAGGGAAGADAAAQLAGILGAGAALELLHASALAHDDLIDASDSRRGRPSTHVRFATLAQRSDWPGDAARFGAAGAVLVGDLLLSWADSAFAAAQTAFPPAAAAAARAMFDAVHHEVLAGQYLDMLEQTRGGFSIEAAQQVVRLKTAKYTVERPLLIGACAAGAGEPTLRALSSYGLAVGEAFQLRDDLLGVFGDPATTGKPAGDDLREGKRTVLVALAMREAGPADREALRSGLGDRGLDDAAIAALRTVLIGTGAADSVEKLIAARLADGLATLDQAARDGAIAPDAAAALAALARASADRES